MKRVASILCLLVLSAVAGCDPTPGNLPVVIKYGRGTVIMGLNARDGNTIALQALYGDGLTIRNCTFTNLGTGALSLIRESNVLIENCTFTACDRLAASSANGRWITGKVLDLWGCRNVTIRNCTWKSQRGGRCIVIWGGTQDANVTGCAFDGVGQAEPNNPDDGAIYLNEGFAGEPVTRRILIQGNTISRCNGKGVYVDGPGAGSPAGAQFCEDVRILDNRIEATIGVLLWAKNSTVRGNDFSRCGKTLGIVLPSAGNIVESNQ